MSCYKGLPRDAFVPVADRFWPRVDVRGPDECWPWMAGKSGEYGTIMVDGRTRRAHQIAWELANGRPFPDDLIGRHSCDNPPCCNPSHVEPGTKADNAKDMVDRGRMFVPPSALPHQRARGERNGGAKLTWESVGAIRFAHSLGEDGASIARRFGIGKSQVHRIVRCQSWGKLHANGGPDHGRSYDAQR